MYDGEKSLDSENLSLIVHIFVVHCFVSSSYDPGCGKVCLVCVWGLPLQILVFIFFFFFALYIIYEVFEWCRVGKACLHFHNNSTTIWCESERKTKRSRKLTYVYVFSASEEKCSYVYDNDDSILLVSGLWEDEKLLWTCPLLFFYSVSGEHHHSYCECIWYRKRKMCCVLTDFFFRYERMKNIITNKPLVFFFFRMQSEPLDSCYERASNVYYKISSGMDSTTWPDRYANHNYKTIKKNVTVITNEKKSSHHNLKKKKK